MANTQTAINRATMDLTALVWREREEAIAQYIYAHAPKPLTVAGMPNGLNAEERRAWHKAIARWQEFDEPGLDGAI